MRESRSRHEVTRYWRPEAASAVELLYAKYLTHSFARHTHDGFAIGLVEEGANSFYYRGSVHTAPAGSVMLLNPAEVHTGGAPDGLGWTFRMFYIHADWLRDLAGTLSARPQDVPFLKGPVVEDELVFQYLRRAHVSLEHSNSLLEQESLLISALSAVVVRHADHRVTPPPCGRHTKQARLLRDYIADNFTRNVSLQELTALVGLSPSHLIRVFRSVIGTSPHAFLNQMRVDHAKQCLRTNHESLSSVALNSGFVDQSHLTRHFKQLVGVTPGRYLKR